MPVHDWTRVEAAIFHAFHHAWISAVSRALNCGILPPEYYALTKQLTSVVGAETVVTIRHSRNHDVVAMVKIVSPQNKANHTRLTAFVRNVRETLAAGVHLLIVDLFPPGAGDPPGIHGAVWGEAGSAGITSPKDKSLTCVTYHGAPSTEAFLELVAVGDALPDMAVFLAPAAYVSVPLEATYRSAWDDLPAYWRDVLTNPPES